MLLPVEDESGGVDLTIEVDGELRDTCHRFADVDERGGAVGVDEASGDTEVTVEPAVVQDAAVHLDGQLSPARGAGVGMRLHPQARRVGVRAHEAERSMRPGIGGGEPPCDDRPAAHDVAGCGHLVPRVGFVQATRSR